MPRLFTGLEVPIAHRTALTLLQSGQPKGTRNIFRWIEPENFHITLRFIGNVSPRTADAIVEALDERDWQAPNIELSELKCFGGAKPTSIYAGIKANDSLNALAASQERLMQSLGLPPDTRRFTPHITIARCRGATADQVARYLSSQGEIFNLPPFRPHRFVLYSAREPQGGGPYRAEELFSFADSQTISHSYEETAIT